MELITPFLPLIIIIAVIVIIVRWRRSIRYIKRGGMDDLKAHGIEPVKNSKRSIPVEFDNLSDKKTWFGARETKQSKHVTALLELFRSKTLDLGHEWRLETASDKQIKYLTKLVSGENVSIPNSLTKGQASDAIGLFNRPEEIEISQLKFFKIPTPGKLNQTEARVTLHKIFANPENIEKWNNRPASTQQKDQIRFFKGKVPKALSHPDAEKVIEELVEADEDRLDRWDDLRFAYEDYVDPDSRELYDIKKFSWKQFCNVVEQLELAGLHLPQIFSDEDKIYEALLQKYPALEK
jgi:hypothetical protein